MAQSAHLYDAAAVLLADLEVVLQGLTPSANDTILATLRSNSEAVLMKIEEAGRRVIKIHARAEYKNLFAVASRTDEEVWSGAVERTRTSTG